MQFTWDESKRRLNIKKHGIDFIDAKYVFNGYTITIEDDRFDYGEQRFLTIGLCKGRVLAIAHMETKDEIRIISIRKANKHEQETFFSQIYD